MKTGRACLLVLVTLGLTAPAMAGTTTKDGVTLAYLIENDGEIVSGDKLFDNFDFEVEIRPDGPVGDGDGDLDVEALVAEYIYVTPIETIDGYGLNFAFMIPDIIEAAPEASLDGLDFFEAAAFINYDVQVTDPNFLISDFHLSQPEIDFPIFGAEVGQEVFGDDGPVAELFTFVGFAGDAAPGDGDGDLSGSGPDWHFLDPEQYDDEFSVTTFVGVAIGDFPTDPALGAEWQDELHTILSYDQVFSQENIIPTPLAAGMGLGLLAVLGVTRRRRA